MKQIVTGLLLSCVIAASTSCASYKSTTSTAKTLNIYGSGVIQRPVIVELDVKITKVTATASGAVGSSVEVLKAEAVSNAIKAANVDVLVEPTYTVVTQKGEITVTVIGFPATYKAFRDIKPEDIPLIQAGILHMPSVAEPTMLSEDKQGKKKLK